MPRIPGIVSQIILLRVIAAPRVLSWRLAHMQELKAMITQLHTSQEALVAQVAQLTTAVKEIKGDRVKH